MSNDTTPERNVVWVVSTGSYSDYTVVAAAESADEAQRLVDRLNADSGCLEYSVESIPFVSPDVQQVSFLRLETVLWDDGTETSMGEYGTVGWPWNVTGVPVQWRWVRAVAQSGRGGRLDVWGIDLERVRKVYSDQRAALLADPALRAITELGSRR